MRRTTMRHSARLDIVASRLYGQLHIVECGVSVVFISQRLFQNPDSMVRIGSTLLLYINKPQEPGYQSISAMDKNGGCQNATKQEYVAPLLELVHITSEQSLLVFSNEHTGEEELFTISLP